MKGEHTNHMQDKPCNPGCELYPIPASMTNSKQGCCDKCFGVNTFDSRLTKCLDPNCECHRPEGVLKAKDLTVNPERMKARRILNDPLPAPTTEGWWKESQECVDKPCYHPSICPKVLDRLLATEIDRVRQEEKKSKDATVKLEAMLWQNRLEAASRQCVEANINHPGPDSTSNIMAHFRTVIARATQEAEKWGREIAIAECREIVEGLGQQQDDETIWCDMDKVLDAFALLSPTKESPSKELKE